MTPAGLALLAVPRFQSAARLMPLSCHEAPVPTPVFHSATSWVGVLPSALLLPTLAVKPSASLTRNLASRLRKFDDELESGREIWSYTPYCVPATGAKVAETKVPLRTT